MPGRHPHPKEADEEVFPPPSTVPQSATPVRKRKKVKLRTTAASPTQGKKDDANFSARFKNVSTTDVLASTQARGVATRKKIATQRQLEDSKKSSLILASAQKSTPPAQAQRSTTKKTPATAQKIQKQRQKKTARKENSDKKNATGKTASTSLSENKQTAEGSSSTGTK